MKRSRSGLAGAVGSMWRTLKYAATRISTHDRHEPRCGVFVRCEFSMMRARISRASFSRRGTSIFIRASGISSLVHVALRLLLELLQVILRPLDAFVEA